MVEISIAKMSSRGQIVIPKQMRNQFKENEEIIILQKGDKIILQNKNQLIKKVYPQIEEINEEYVNFILNEPKANTFLSFEESEKSIKDLFKRAQNEKI